MGKKKEKKKRLVKEKNLQREIEECISQLYDQVSALKDNLVDMNNKVEEEERFKKSSEIDKVLEDSGGNDLEDESKKSVKEIFFNLLNLKKDGLVKDLSGIKTTLCDMAKLLDEISLKLSKHEKDYLLKIFSTKKNTYNILDPEIKKLVRNALKYYTKKHLHSLLNVSTKSMRRWEKSNPDKNVPRGRKKLDPDMEKKLINWLDTWSKDIKISSKNIMKKAKELSSNKDFKASKGWFNSFRKGKDNLLIKCEDDKRNNLYIWKGSH